MHHPASTLTEALPNNTDDSRPASLLPALSPRNHAVPDTGVHENHVLQSDGSPPSRKDTNSSVSTTATLTSSLTLATDDTSGTPYSPNSVASSPTFAHPIFSARDGSNVGPQRRASRRRTGPLTAVQRDRAHLIRKMGACPDCRRRRVACHPNHHNMTWEEAARRFRSHESPAQGLSPLDGPQLSPAPPSSRPPFAHDPREMDLDTSPSQQHAQPALSESRIRTPLPSGPRPEKLANLPPLPGFDSFRTDLQGSADRILANPFRSRYASVSVLLVRWQDDQDFGGQSAWNDLAKTFREDYNYAVHKRTIPAATESSKSPWLLLSQVVTDFIADHNQRDCLNILYYSGYSYLDRDREMVLASSKHAGPASVIPWRGIQHCFENARSDALLLLDCAYYPSYSTVRREGVLELIAASAGEDQADRLGRSVFTRALTDQLRTRAVQPFKEPFSAAELHSRLLSLYPRMIPEQEPEKEVLASFPTPLSMQLSSNKTLPSILLAPLRHGEAPGASPGGSQLSITFRLADDTFNMDTWAEWLRLMPAGITEARVEGPYRNTFQ